MSKKVIVAMSGGVDSSVSAYLLKKEGYEVMGLFMRNWDEEGTDKECPAEQDFQDVVKVCEHLDIPYYTVNFSKEYKERVFSHFLEEYEAGFTPNPDILCNREIKFDVFFKKALSLGADYLATGHYCQIHHEGNTALLARGKDSNKDQSYFLYTIKSSILSKVLFPIGGLEKPEVRKIAKEAGLSTSSKKDSTGICFIGKRNFKSFLSHYIPAKPGPILDLEGNKVGEHEGIAYHTIGQRRGLGIGGEGSAWFVAAKDLNKNALIVVQGEDHSALFAPELIATDETWVSTPPIFPLKCQAKIRYRSDCVGCTVTQEGHKLRVTFDEKTRAITPRQSIVFYQGEICLGGALIERAIGNPFFA